MTTIKDIARLAGVSIATVSRVLNGQSGVSESKRQKVLKVAEETHYSLNRFAAGIKEKAPHVLVLFTSEEASESCQDELLGACEEAADLFSSESMQVEYYGYSELDEAAELLEKIREEEEDLEGLILLGGVPEILRRELTRLRGRGCPMILAAAEDEELSPLSVIDYEYAMLYDLIAELVPLFDRERKALIFHESPAGIDGEGAFSLPGFELGIQSLRALYPEKAVYKQNKGAFAPEIFPEGSCVVLDSEDATRIALQRYKTPEEGGPAIIGFGNSPELQDALADNRLAALLDLSPYELSFRAGFSLMRRLLLKRKIPVRQHVFPNLYMKSMLPEMQYRQKLKERLAEESGDEAKDEAKED